MSKFLSGYCDDAYDFGAYYLYNEHGICTCRDGDSNNTTNHAWLIMDEGQLLILQERSQILCWFQGGSLYGKRKSILQEVGK